MEERAKKKKEEVLNLPPLTVTASEKLIKMHARRRQLPQHEVPPAGLSLIEFAACFLLIAAALSVCGYRSHNIVRRRLANTRHEVSPRASRPAQRAPQAACILRYLPKASIPPAVEPVQTTAVEESLLQASIPSVVTPDQAVAMEEAVNNKMKKFNQHRDEWQHRHPSL